ncbi:Differentially expressed in FDCP 8 [Bulinus truncatus]|nr:Differentially expressed in FDCP 8 [Bulinus truncatus]
MEKKGAVKYLDTSAATVKMSSGIPFTAGQFLDSESEEETYDKDELKNNFYKENNNVLISKDTNTVNNTNGIAYSSHVKTESTNSNEIKTDHNKIGSISIENGLVNNHEVYTADAPDNSSKSKSSKPKTVFIPKGYYSPAVNSSSDHHSYSVSPIIPRQETFESKSMSMILPKKQNNFLSKLQDNGQVVSSSESSNSPITDERLKGKIPPNRINPFNKYSDLIVDEDYFSDSQENYFKTERHSTNSTKSSLVSQGADWWHEVNNSDVTFAELGLSEDHFSHPQGHFGLSCTEELELAIDNCKEMIRDAIPASEKQKNLIMKLVQLRIKLQELKEGPEPVPENVKVILSHKMMLKTSRTSKYYCEKCNGAIWGMVQAWYRCTECGYRCHEKCLQQILRTCAKAKVLEDPTLIMDIVPKDSQGLMAQNYRCWECRSPISFKTGGTEPRLCDYTGRYYCELCHWNDTFIIPSRVLHNWDFTPQKVCRASKQFLKLMQKKAVIRIQDINPLLFVYVDQLNEIKKLREEMMIIKKYILSCASAMSAKLLLLLESRQHFVESSDRYSMQDLLDSEDVLLPELVKIHSTWAQHIKVECQLCQGRGFCCELCGAEEVLFPFDNIAVVCSNCSSVTHRHCFAKKCICLRCERRRQMQILMGFKL